MEEYPKMLAKEDPAGDLTWEGLTLSTITVDSEEAELAAEGYKPIPDILKAKFTQ